MWNVFVLLNELMWPVWAFLGLLLLGSLGVLALIEYRESQYQEEIAEGNDD